MRTFATSLAVGCGLLACASGAFAQAGRNTDQPLRFEEELVVTPSQKADTAVRGDPLDYYLTFNAPVGIPGVTLAAGTYLFRLPAGHGSDMVQVLKADRSDIYSTFVAARTEDAGRTIFSDGRIVLSKERQPGAAPRIKEWYLPGRSVGLEFIYPQKPQ